MLRTHARRYSLFALIMALIFVGAQIVLEMMELRLPLNQASLTEALNANELPIISMALIFTALAWWAGRQRDRLGAQRRYVEALNQVTLNLLHAGDLDRALQEIIVLLTRALGGEDGALFVKGPEQLNVRASTPRVSLRWLETMLVLLTQHTPGVIDDQVLAFWLDDFSAVVDETLKPVCRQLFAAVLPDGKERGAGWLVVTTKRAVPLSPEQKDFLQSAAGQIAALLTRTRHMVELRRRARDLDAIAQVNRTLLAGMDLDELLQTVVSATQVRFGLPLVGVMWVDETARDLCMRAVAGPMETVLPRGYRQPLTEGIAGVVYRTGEPYLAHDVSQDPYYLPREKQSIQSSFMVPMQVGQHVIGIMEFDSLGRDAFNEEDVAALTTLTDLVTIAAESARLVSEAQRERRRLSVFLRSAVDVILLVDAQGLIQLMNPAAERLLNLAAEEAIGRPIDRVLTRRQLLAVYQQAVAPLDHELTETAEATLDNGTTYLITITRVRDEDGIFAGRVVAMKDITPLKQLDRYKSQMLQMASHDLRTPLGVAIGYVELLRNDLQPVTPLRDRLLSGLEAALERMESLTTELLDVERVESGVDQVRVPLDIGSLLTMVVQDLQDTAGRKQQTLELEALPAAPMLQGDPVRLKQVINNLVDNALKYTPDGGHVWVRLKPEARGVIFEVQDTGYGIPQAAHAKLFQRFYRAKVPGTESLPGTGLGLSLVKSIVEQHGGRVTVDSAERQGSTFRVWLPVIYNEQPATDDQQLTTNG